MARHGLLEYRLGRSRDGTAQVVTSNPRSPTIGRERRSSAIPDISALSRFAYMRRRGNDMVLELPRAGALFTDLR